MPPGLERSRPQHVDLYGETERDLEIRGVLVAYEEMDLSGYDRVTFTDCKVDSTRLSAGSSTEVDFRSSHVVGSDLSGLSMPHGCGQSRFEDCKFAATDLSAARLFDVSFIGCTLVAASLRLCKLRRIEFRSCRISGLDVSHSTLEDVSFDGSRIHGLNLDRTSCSRVNFRAADSLGVTRASSLAECDVSAAQAIDIAIQLAQEAGIRVEGYRCHPAKGQR